MIAILVALFLCVAFLWCLRKKLYLYEGLLEGRAGKLLKKGKTFVVVAVDELYFPAVYMMIREDEKRHGKWGDCDERAMELALDEWRGLSFSTCTNMKPNWRISIRSCLGCSVWMTPVAHDTGDGWWLSYECDACGEQLAEDEAIEWPFVSDRASPDQLEAVGFRIV